MNLSNTWRGIPPVTKNLIIINVAIWLVGLVIPSFGRVLYDKLGLHLVGSDSFNPIQVITYMFLHDEGNVLHILFNMFTLWMFGRILEQVWGSKRFFMFYMVCGIGAAIVQEAVWMLTWKSEFISALAASNGFTVEHTRELLEQGLASGDARLMGFAEDFKSSFLTVGASGAIFGLLLGFAMTFPNMPLYIFFIPVPIKAKYMVIGYAVLEFFLGVSGGGTIAHFAHLGGMLFGLGILLYWKKKGMLRGNGFY